LCQRKMDVIPTNMRHVLSQLLLADVSHRSFMSKQELSYSVMDLPLVRKTFANIDVVGFYRRSYLTLKRVMIAPLSFLIALSILHTQSDAALRL